MPLNKLETVRLMVQAKEVKRFKDLFIFCKKTVLAKKMKITPGRMNQLINKIEEIKVVEIAKLAHIMGVDSIYMSEIILEGYDDPNRPSQALFVEEGF